MTPGRRWGTTTDASTAMIAYRPSSSAMHSNDDIDWPSLLWFTRSSCATPNIHRFLEYDLQQRITTTHGRTMITCDAWQLIEKAPDVRRVYWHAATHIPLLYALCMTCQASSCSICLQSLDSPFQIRCQRPALTSIEKYWQDKWFVELNLCGKTDGIIFL